MNPSFESGTVTCTSGIPTEASQRLCVSISGDFHLNSRPTQKARISGRLASPSSRSSVSTQTLCLWLQIRRTLSYTGIVCNNSTSFVWASLTSSWPTSFQTRTNRRGFVADSTCHHIHPSASHAPICAPKTSFLGTCACKTSFSILQLFPVHATTRSQPTLLVRPVTKLWDTQPSTVGLTVSRNLQQLRVGINAAGRLTRESALAENLGLDRIKPEHHTLW